jgi:predicted DCC family thiol-disulfide oxidoreductase YuxK
LLSRPVLLFDGQCGFCRQWVARLERWDRRGAIQTLPGAERHTLPGLPQISDASLDRAMQFITPDGRVRAGARALPALLPYLPGGRVLASAFRIPVIQLAADRLYAWISARRHRFGCGDRCALP